MLNFPAWLGFPLIHTLHQKPAAQKEAWPQHQLAVPSQHCIIDPSLPLLHLPLLTPKDDLPFHVRLPGNVIWRAVMS